MDFNNLLQIVELSSILLLVLFSHTLKGCKRVEHKSDELVAVERFENAGWFSHWVTYYESPTLHTYTVCYNISLEIGTELKIDGPKNDIKYILFKNSTIPTIPVGVFTSFINLTEIYLNGTGIKNIHPGAFSGLMNLEELYLQDNEIEILERGVLNYLLHLKLLDLSRNRLKIIEENSLLGLLNLQEIFLNQNDLHQPSISPFHASKLLKVVQLSNNSLKELSGVTFSNLTSLEIVLLNNNQLTELQAGIFENSTSLKILDVSTNNLTNVDFTGFASELLLFNLSHNNIGRSQNWSQLRNIEKLDISYNQISLIDEIRGEIKFLSLSWNNIDTIHDFAFKVLKTLIELDLGHNLLSVIRENTFQNLTELKVLQLNDNKIDFLTVGCFRNLISLIQLDLSRNSLSNLEFGTFTGLNNLKKLSLAHNKLVILHENSFYVFENIRILFLNNNSLKSLKIEDVLEHTTQLKFLDLNHNDWDCNELFLIMKHLQEHSITFPHGQIHNKANVYGIGCKNKAPLHKIEDLSLESSSTPVSCPDQSKLVTSQKGNTSFYKYLIDYKDSLKESLLNAKLIKSFSNTSFLKFFTDRFTKKHLENNVDSNSLVEKNYHSSENMEMINTLQDFSGRITGFIAIMTTILLIMILLFVFLFVKPNPNAQFDYNRPAHLTEFEMR